MSTSKEKTRKIGVGQEQIAYTHPLAERAVGTVSEVRAQSVGPVPTARSPSPAPGCWAAAVFVLAPPAQPRCMAGGESGNDLGSSG